MPFIRVKTEDLRIGLYIKLGGSWFKHPFPTNTFKIKSEREINIIRSLRNVKVYYDPRLSDGASTKSGDDSTEGSMEYSPESIPPSPVCFDEGEAVSEGERSKRHEQYLERVLALKEAEKAYQEVINQNKTMIKEIRAGYARAIGKAEDLVMNLGKTLANEGSVMSVMNLMGAADFGDEFYYHSLNVCILSLILAKEFDYSDETLKRIGLGALFHDIGELEETTKIMGKGLPALQEELRIRHSHPHNGVKMLSRGFGIAEESMKIVEQHHERLNGKGYPNKLRGDAIHPFSKIVMVADAYDEVFNNPDIEKSLTPHEALCTLYAKRQDEFWEEAVVALIQNLGIYPPSTIVELSNGAVGVVCRVNIADRLRPTLMLYEKSIPADEAIIVDLAQEPALTIKQSLRPKDVSKAVWKYLNPRGMISYFAYADANRTSSPSQPPNKSEASSKIAEPALKS